MPIEEEIAMFREKEYWRYEANFWCYLCVALMLIHFLRCFK